MTTCHAPTPPLSSGRPLRSQAAAALFLLLSFCAAEAPSAEPDPPPPQLSWSSSQQLIGTGLPPVLGEETVAKHLDSGLTTTLLFRLDIEPINRHWVRVQIRYELWDEHYLTALTTADGSTHRETLESRQALESWWSTLSLPFVVGTSKPKSAVETTLHLDVLPFSQSEELDTQRWFADSVRQAERRSASDSGVATEGVSNSLERVVDVLLATSIRRRSLTRHRWTVRVPARNTP